QRSLLADVVIRCGMAHLDRAGLYRIENAKSAHQFAGRIGTYVEFAIGEKTQALAEILRAAVQGIQTGGPAGRHAPADSRTALRVDVRCGYGGRCANCTNCCGFQKFTSFHLELSPKNMWKEKLMYSVV